MEEEDSINSLADFEFKYIPKKEFDKIVMKVRERKAVDAWARYCLEKEEVDKISEVKAPKILNDVEIQSVIESAISRKPAPFLGPARKFSMSAILNQREKSKSSSEESSDASTIHIDENVMASKSSSQIKIQVQNGINDDSDSCSSSISEPEKCLHNEMMKLCYEIESVNGVNPDDNDDSSVGLTFQEKKHLQNFMDKTEEKIICETYGKIIDKKFDFLYDELKNSDDEAERAQTLPAVEPPQNKKLPSDSNADFTNDNNVWRPKAENQIRKSDVRQREATKKNDNDVFPSGSAIRKVGDVRKLKRLANEKPQDDFERVEELQQEESVSLKADVFAALGRVTEYQRKICQYIDYLREIVEDPPEVDDMNDLQRRQKRATGFSNRFARNHLYQIGRIAEEIRIMSDNPLDVAAKVNVLFQVIMQAIQTYLKNIEMFIYNSYPDKLLVLIDFVINATKICLDRMAIDKKESVVGQMLRKCSSLKDFLEINQRSMAKFTSIAEQRRRSINSRSSFAFEVPQSSKLSMYDGPSHKSRRPMRQLPAKSPYDQPKTIRTSQSAVQGKYSKVQSREPSQQQSRQPSRLQSREHSRKKSPMLSRKTSNISTMMERMKEEEIIETKTEKLLDDAPRSEIENELHQILMNVAEEKISQLLMPLIEQFKSAQQSFFQSSQLKGTKKSLEKLEENPSLLQPAAKPRVTSEIETVKDFPTLEPKTGPKNIEKVDRISKNVQYIYVKSEDERSFTKPVESTQDFSHSKPELTSSKSGLMPLKIHQSPSQNSLKTLSAQPKPPIPIRNISNSDDGIYSKKMKALAIKERLYYIEQQSQNPLYVNKASDEPWKLVSNISDKIVDGVLQNVLAGMDFGEKIFIEKFLSSELKL